MIVFSIIPRNQHFFDFQDLKVLTITIVRATYLHKFLGIAHSIATSTSNELIEITFNKVYPEGDLGKYLIRELQIILSKLGLAKILQVKSLRAKLEIGDIKLDWGYVHPRESVNSLMLTPYVKDSEIPQEFLCQMSNEIMDEPVYTRFRPDLRYNANHLKYWLFFQNQPTDPITRQNLDPVNDIIHDYELKMRIQTYVTEIVEKSIIARKDKFIEIMDRYGQFQICEENINRAFRRAASENNIDGLNALLYKVNNINAQDKNPLNKKTALHWAIIRGATNATARLLELKALTNIKDASNKSAYDYALESTNNDIRDLFKIERVSSRPELLLLKSH